MSGTLRRTCLHDEHVRLGARPVPSAGGERPVQYAGIIEEHNAVRTDAGMFDVSHMGRYEVSGPQAAALLRYVCTFDMTHLQPGQGHYAAVCRPDGGIMDDVYVYCLPAIPSPSPARRERGGPEGRGAGPRYLLVANASNADKISDWLRRSAPGLKGG